MNKKKVLRGLQIVLAVLKVILSVFILIGIWREIHEDEVEE